MILTLPRMMSGADHHCHPLLLLLLLIIIMILSLPANDVRRRPSLSPIIIMILTLPRMMSGADHHCHPLLL